MAGRNTESARGAEDRPGYNLQPPGSEVKESDFCASASVIPLQRLPEGVRRSKLESNSATRKRRSIEAWDDGYGSETSSSRWEEGWEEDWKEAEMVYETDSSWSELDEDWGCGEMEMDWVATTEYQNNSTSKNVYMGIGQRSRLPESSLPFGPVTKPPPPARTPEQAEEGVNRLLWLAMHHSHLWEILVGMYFQEGRHPHIYLGRNQGKAGSLLVDWEPDLLMQDMRERYPARCPAPYTKPPGEEGRLLEYFAAAILDGNEDLFRSAIKKWHLKLMAHSPWGLNEILQRAGWCRSVAALPEWSVIARLKRLPDGPDKNAQLQCAFQELPRFFMRCYNDPSCR